MRSLRLLLSSLSEPGKRICSDKKPPSANSMAAVEAKPCFADIEDEASISTVQVDVDGRCDKRPNSAAAFHGFEGLSPAI